MKNGDGGSEKSGQNRNFQKEPVDYEEEYYYIKKRSTPAVVLGFLFIGIGIYTKWNDEKTVHIPLVTIVGGLFFLYAGFRGLQDKSPQLKMAKQGIWTKRRGFTDWNDIFKTRVTEVTDGRSSQTFLDIYYKASVFALGDQPDERVDLTNMEDNQFVEMVIHTLMSKRNELKS